MRPCPLLALPLLFLGRPAAAAGDPPPVAMTYAVWGDDVPHLDRVVRRAWADGWRDLCGVLGSRTPAPPLVRVDDPFRAKLVVDTNPPPGTHPAEARRRHAPASGQIVVYHAHFRQYGRALRGHILAHELLHFYFHLPDQYHAGEDIQPGCAMGDYVRYGWSGALCASCRAQVAAVRAAESEKGVKAAAEKEKAKKEKAGPPRPAAPPVAP